MNTLIRFFEKHGQDWTPASFTGERMPRKACFSNALHYALDNGLRYVEGVAIRIAPIHHAWCVDAGGTVVDPTWDRPEDCAYKGIAFDAADARLMTLEQGCYGLFDRAGVLNWELIGAYDSEFRDAEQRRQREIEDFLKTMRIPG